PPPAAIITNLATDETYFYDGVGGDPSAVSTGVWGADEDAAVSPDGVTTYVLRGDNYFGPGQLDLIAVDTATQAVRGVIASIGTSETRASRLALSPDGTMAYVGSGDSLTRITISARVADPPIALGGDLHAVAVSPDGRFVYASAGNRFLKVNPRNGSIQSSLDLGQLAGAIKLSADGATAYVIGDIVGSSGAVLFKINLQSFTISNQVGLPGSTASGAGSTKLGLALSPDQHLLYVVGGDAANRQYFALPVDALYLLAGQVVPIQNTVPWPVVNDAAFSPDGSKLYTYTRGEQGAVDLLVTIDVPSNTVTTSYNLGALYSSDLTSVTTPPDQAPVAAFTSTLVCPTGASTFNASGSSTPSGSIASYTWDFGDGTAQVTTPSPAASHQFAGVARYQVRLTVTNSAGTSTTVVSDGQTVLHNGGPSATVRNAVRIPACSGPV
ncbi:MAG: PKD domain-containing protein, partial [Actinomycetales bacterium]